MEAREKLDALIAQAVAYAGVSLVEVDIFRAGKRKTIRIYIDKPKGVTIEDCTKVSRHLSDALDENPQVVEDAYTLEVSSPGLDRPLKSDFDFERNVGRYLRVTRSTGKPLVGKLVEFNKDVLTLILKGNAGQVDIPRSEILVVKVDVQI